MVILGKDERAEFEADRSEYSVSVQNVYDDSKTYHDGKWLMFEPVDTSLFGDFMELLVDENLITVSSLQEAIAFSGEANIYIAGGYGLFKEAIPLVDKMYITEVDTIIDNGDVFFPEFDYAKEKHAKKNL